MKVKKGEIVIYISPNDYPLYKKGGWKKLDERSREEIARNNEKARIKRLAKSQKGGNEDVKSN